MNIPRLPPTVDHNLNWATVQWRWVLGMIVAIMVVTSTTLFIIIAIIAAGRASFSDIPTQAEINQVSDFVSVYIGPPFFVSMTFLATLWMARKIDMAPTVHGLLIGLGVCAASMLGDYFLSPSLTGFEVISALTAVGSGWLGGYRGERILRKQAAVYRTSQAIRGADRQAIVTAIGQQLADPSVALIALGAPDKPIRTAWISSPSVQKPATMPVIPDGTEPITILRGAQLPWTQMGLRTLLLLPLTPVNEVLLVGSQSNHGFARNEIQDYQTIAEQVALSLENLRLVEEARDAGITQERERLAAEIHDGLTQGFVSIVAHLEVADARLEQYSSGLGADLSADLRQLLAQISQTARDNLRAARQMTWALRPDLKTNMSLENALTKVAQKWTATSGVPVTVTSSGEARQLHPDIETMLLRTGREALNNVQKHAGASRVTVTLTYLDTLVALDVADNGQGFDPAERTFPQAASGFGLTSLQAQATRLGGELAIESTPGAGCTIAISIPTKTNSFFGIAGDDKRRAPVE